MFARALPVVVFELLNEDIVRSLVSDAGGRRVDAGSWSLWTPAEGESLSPLGAHLVRSTDEILQRMMPAPENRAELHVAKLTGAPADGDDILSRAGVFFHHVIRLMLASWTHADLAHAREVTASKARKWHPTWQLMTEDLARCVSLVAKTMRPGRTESAYRAVGEAMIDPMQGAEDPDDDGYGERLPPAADISADASGDEERMSGDEEGDEEGVAHDLMQLEEPQH
jgi:hypothetical protein